LVVNALGLTAETKLDFCRVSISAGQTSKRFLRIGYIPSGGPAGAGSSPDEPETDTSKGR